MEIRLIADGEEELCNKFHNRIYKDNRSMQQWKWEFALNNYDRRPIPYVVVVDNGEIVGTQAFIPIRMIDADGWYWTAKSEETLVDPDYRGKRLFEKMYRLLFSYANEHELVDIWGFTPATRAFERLGFSIPAQTEQIFVPFSNKSIPAMMSKSPHGGKKNLADKLKIAAIRSGCVFAQAVSSLKIAYHKRRTIDGLDIRTWHQPDEQAGLLCRRFIQQWGGRTIYRDAEFLQWRLFDNPYVKSVVRALYYRDQLLGWTAFTLGDDGMGYLVDLMAADDGSGYTAQDLIRLLLLEAVLGTKKMGATGIRGWRVNSHPFDKLICRVAERIGFYHIKRGHAVVLYSCKARKKRVTCGKFDDWFVSRVYTEGVLG